uniref:Variant surface glycoprotein 1269 n=1 Tax=Trypanosoma brucei TaxID=5691 RepID=M4SUZ8_9TRYP|nr:variant surface glycoprotein 1269 [Trypanosoma brucei]
MLGQLITLFLLASKAESAVNSNAAEFKALCDLIRLAEAKGKIDISIDTSAADNAIKELDYLNLSAAEDGWKKDKNGLLAKKQPDEKATEREAWERHVAGLGEKDAKTGKYKYMNLTNQRRRPSLAIALNRTLRQAQDLKTTYDGYANAIKTAAAQAQKALTDALYGADNEQFSKVGLKATQDLNCKDDSGGVAGKALAWDLLCICTGDQSNSLKLCDQAQTGGNVDDYTNSGKAEQAYRTAVSACPAADPETTPTPDTLKEALAVFKSLIGRQAETATGASGHYIFGQPHTDGACNGSSNQGMCVSYKSSVKGGRTSMHWATAIAAAATEMTNAAQANQEARAVSGQLTAMAVHAWALFDDVLHEPDHKQPNTVSGKDTPKSSEDKEKECNSAKDETECKTKSGCHYVEENKDSKKCTLSEEAKNEVQDAAEKAGKNRMCSTRN